ncbi:MAG: DUF433 domain-containing protein [Methanospirillaceae archaeon]|nr:DUF433 domain-containing protein [Methanospirillaceae archaeon]
MYSCPPLSFIRENDSRIILDASVPAGKPIIRGTRISVDPVPDLLASGWDESSL